MPSRASADRTGGTGSATAAAPVEAYVLVCAGPRTGLVAASAAAAIAVAVPATGVGWAACDTGLDGTAAVPITGVPRGPTSRAGVRPPDAPAAGVGFEAGGRASGLGGSLARATLPLVSTA